jgi:nickel transport protein
MRILGLALSAFWAAAVGAHDLWLEADGSDYLLLQGHRHAAHAGGDLVAYPAGFVQRTRCGDAQGRTRELTFDPAYPVRLPGDCAALLVQASSGPWTKTVHGTRPQAPAGLEGVLTSWQALEGVKLLATWSPALRQPLAASLELSPQHDPFSLQPGDKLRLLVSYRGQPQAGVTVAYDGRPRGVTGDDGRINLRIRHPGLQLVSASFEAPVADGPVAKTIHNSVLQFQLPDRDAAR